MCSYLVCFYFNSTGWPKNSCETFGIIDQCSAGENQMRIIRYEMSCIFLSFEDSIKWYINIVHFWINFVYFCWFGSFKTFTPLDHIIMAQESLFSAENSSIFAPIFSAENWHSWAHFYKFRPKNLISLRFMPVRTISAPTQLKKF